MLGGEGSHEQEVNKVCSVLLVRVLQTDGQGCGLRGRRGGGWCLWAAWWTDAPPSVSLPPQGGCWGCNMCLLLKVPALPRARMASFASGV